MLLRKETKSERSSERKWFKLVAESCPFGASRRHLARDGPKWYRDSTFGSFWPLQPTPPRGWRPSGGPKPSEGVWALQGSFSDTLRGIRVQKFRAFKIELKSIYAPRSPPTLVRSLRINAAAQLAHCAASPLQGKASAVRMLTPWVGPRPPKPQANL